jgi:hypothetical protein
MNIFFMVGIFLFVMFAIYTLKEERNEINDFRERVARLEILIQRK